MNRRKALALFSGSLLLLFIIILLSLFYGAKSVSVNNVLGAFANANDLSFEALVVKERIPRTIFGILAGAALGVSGTMMQAITRNPIADPGILGVNTGAALFVVSGITFFNINTANEYIWFAIAGAALTTIFVYSIGSMGVGGATPIKLALAGAAVSAALSSLVSAVILPRTEVMNSFRFWQVGSIGAATWDNLSQTAPLLLFGLALSILLSPSLNVMALGDEMASGLGVRTGFIRMCGAAASVLLCGVTTAVAGPIGFVGLMVPHIIRLLFTSDLRILIPLSAMGGAILLTLADVAGRLLGSPGELEAGVITAFLGAPILIFVARKTKGRGV